MVSFEVVGLFDCPWYAKVGKIADKIMNKNPLVEFSKEMLDPTQWTEFVEKMKTVQGWDIKHSPCIYELFTDRESKARLIGDVNDFCEFALIYFDATIDFNSTALNDLVTANKTRWMLDRMKNPEDVKGCSEICLAEDLLKQKMNALPFDLNRETYEEQNKREEVEEEEDEDDVEEEDEEVEGVEEEEEEEMLWDETSTLKIS